MDYSSQAEQMLELIEKLKSENEGSNKVEPKIKEGFQMSLKYQKKFTKPALLLKDAPLINIGEIFTLVALPGSGKSQTMEIIIAAFVAKKYGLSIDTLGFNFNISDEKELLFIDHERPLDINRDGYERSCNRLNAPHLINPETGKLPFINYQCFIEEPSTELRKKLFVDLVSSGKYELVLVDGILGFTDTLNDEKEANKIVLWLLSLASKYQFALVVTMHPNKGTDTMAGHIGAFLYRYSRACLLLKTHDQDKEIKVITNQFSQQKTSYYGGELTIGMRYDKDLRMFVSEDNLPDGSIGSLYNPDTIKTIFWYFLNEHKTKKIQSGRFQKQYSIETGLTEETARKHCGKAIKEGLIKSEGKGKATTYTLYENY